MMTEQTKTTLQLKSELMPLYMAMSNAHYYAYDIGCKGDLNRLKHIARWKEQKNKFYSWWNKLSKAERTAVKYFTINSSTFEYLANNELHIHLD